MEDDTDEEKHGGQQIRKPVQLQTTSAKQVCEGEAWQGDVERSS